MKHSNVVQKCHLDSGTFPVCVANYISDTILSEQVFFLFAYSVSILAWQLQPLRLHAVRRAAGPNRVDGLLQRSHQLVTHALGRDVRDV